MSGRGGQREPGPGKKLGAPTKAERLAKASATGTPSVAGYFGAKPAARSEEVGSPRDRAPGGTPTKQEVTRMRREEPVLRAEPIEQSQTANIGAGSPASQADEEDDSEVEITGVRTREQRDAEGLAAAVKVEDDDDGAGASDRSCSQATRQPSSPPLTPKKEPTDSARRAAHRRLPTEAAGAAESTSLLGEFVAAMGRLQLARLPRGRPHGFRQALEGGQPSLRRDEGRRRVARKGGARAQGCRA